MGLRMWLNGVRLLHTSINIEPDIKTVSHRMYKNAIWYTIKAHELKSRRRWKVFGKYVDKELPVLIKMFSCG